VRKTERKKCSAQGTAPVGKTEMLNREGVKSHCGWSNAKAWAMA
jgi:hypothetical protein